MLGGDVASIILFGGFIVRVPAEKIKSELNNYLQRIPAIGPAPGAIKSRWARGRRSEVAPPRPSGQAAVDDLADSRAVKTVGLAMKDFIAAPSNAGTVLCRMP